MPPPPSSSAPTWPAAKTYHPDALSRMGLDDDTREMANAVFAEIGKAHAVLSDFEQRRDYDARLETDSTDIDANLLAQAETLFLKAEVMIKAGNFKGALEFAEPAAEALARGVRLPERPRLGPLQEGTLGARARPRAPRDRRPPRSGQRREPLPPERRAEGPRRGGKPPMTPAVAPRA